MSDRVVSLDGVVTGFSLAEAHIDCMCGRELLKLDRRSGDVICRKAVFEKEGLSRKLTAYGGQIFVYDFCMFYVFSQDDYGLVGKWQLGSDLSSDICGMAVDEDTIYCSIRNGRIITIDRQSHSMKEFHISDSSMWSVKAHEGRLLCGTVDGKVLQLDKAALSVEKELVLGKKNIGSLYIDGETMYAAGHDGKLYKISIRDFEIESMAKKAHRKMFHCIGLYKDMLVTVSYPCSEIAFWNKDTLAKLKVLDVPLSLSGSAYIEDDSLYITSRNIPGIDLIRLGG